MLLVIAGIMIMPSQWLANPSRENYMEHFKISQLYLSPSEKDSIASIVFKDKRQEVASYLNKTTDRYNFNGNILVSYKGYEIFHDSYGLKNLRDTVPMTKDAVFQLASVSKQFTAIAAMLLKEEGKLNYDDPVTKYFPDFPYERVTIRHLLNHTSGLPNYMWLLENKWDKDYTPYNTEVVEFMAEEELHLHFYPGRFFSYSNTGYMVLAAVIEKASGMRYSEYLSKKIFNPLEMNNTFVYSSAIEKDYPEKLTGYRHAYWGYFKISNTINDGCVGDKNIYSTTSDLFKFEKALFSGKILSQKQLNVALNEDSIQDKLNPYYGFGFRLKGNGLNKVVYHDGMWNGFRTSLKHIEATNSAVIVLNNTNQYAKTIISNKLENIVKKQPENSLTMAFVNHLFEVSNNPEMSFEDAFSEVDFSRADLQKINKIKDFLNRNERYLLGYKVNKYLEKSMDAIMKQRAMPYPEMAKLPKPEISQSGN